MTAVTNAAILLTVVIDVTKATNETISMKDHKKIGQEKKRVAPMERGWANFRFFHKGGDVVGQFLILADKCGGLYPPFLAVIVCEQPLMLKAAFSSFHICLIWVQVPPTWGPVKTLPQTLVKSKMQEKIKQASSIYIKIIL